VTSAYNIEALARSLSVLVIVAIAQVVVLSAGQFNLCLTAIGAASGILAAWLMQDLGAGAIWAILGGLAVGLLLGAVQGLVIVRSGINPFVVTLALASVYFGILLGASQGAAFSRLDADFLAIGRAYMLGLPVVVVVAALVTVAVWLMFHRTILGRELLATGASAKVAGVSGIRTGRVVIAAHTLSGGLAAVAALLLVSTLGSAQASLGASWLLPSFAAPVLGGTALAGGRVSIPGTVLGATFLGLLANGLVLMGVSDYWYQTVLGTLLMAALVLDRLRRGRT